MPKLDYNEIKELRKKLIEELGEDLPGIPVSIEMLILIELRLKNVLNASVDPEKELDIATIFKAEKNED